MTGTSEAPQAGPGPTGVTAPRARILRWVSAAILLAGVTVLVTAGVVPGLPVAGVWVVVGVLASTVLAAALVLRRARQWQRLAGVPVEREPARVEVIRVVLTRTGFAVDYRPVRGARVAHTFGIDRLFDLELPRPGEELDVRSLGADGSGPLLVRQADGTWWAASGRLY